MSNSTHARHMGFYSDPRKRMGPSSNPKKQMGLHPGRLSHNAPGNARRYVPVREFNLGRHAKDRIQAKEYLRTHADQSEHLPLYDDVYNELPDTQTPYEFNTIMTPNQTSQVKKMYHDLNQQMFSLPGPGLFRESARYTPFSEDIRRINEDWVRNPEKYLTGFRYGSTFGSFQYDQGEALYYDDQFDRYPSALANVPRETRPTTDHLEQTAQQMYDNGDFQWGRHVDIPYY